jgi:hypothetical protein
MQTRSGCFPMGALGLLAAFVATIGWLVVHRVSNEPVTPAPGKPLEATPPGDTHGGASYLQASYPRITFNR